MVEYEYQVKGTAQDHYSTRENIMENIKKTIIDNIEYAAIIFVAVLAAGSLIVLNAVMANMEKPATETRTAEVISVSTTKSGDVVLKDQNGEQHQYDMHRSERRTIHEGDTITYYVTEGGAARLSN